MAGGAGEALAPLMEGLDPMAAAGASGGARREGWGLWVRGQLQLAHAPAYAAVAAAGASATVLDAVHGLARVLPALDANCQAR